MASLSAEAVVALRATDPFRYQRVWANDLVITPACALAQIQGLTDEIRRLEGL